MNLDPAKTAFIFPGQGSQAVGMGRELAQQAPIVRHTFEQADEILGYPLSHLAWEGPESELNDTFHTQPALLVHSVGALLAFQARNPDFKPAYVAGHSMGEFSALVAAGALSFPAALSLVRKRGELMKNAGDQEPGGMAAVLGLGIPVLENICARVSQAGGVVQVANDNCPGQVVISGSDEALERALVQAREAGARRAVRLAVSIPAHSVLMKSAQAEFSAVVAASPLFAPRVPVVGNVNARPLSTIEAIRADLEAQLTHRVRWTESIQFMLAEGVTTFIEVGSGNVLLGLLRRIDRSAQGFSLGTPEDFASLDAGG